MAKKEKFRLDPESGELLPVLNADGQELPDPVPMAPPVGFVREPPLHERIRAMVQAEYLRAREQSEVESEAEANDFRIPGDGGGEDPREGRFVIEPGFEDEWEDNYEPPADFSEMRQRLVDAGWTPPERKAADTALSSTAAPSKADADPPRGGSGGSKPSEPSGGSA